MSAAPPVQRLHVGVGLVPARLFRSRPRLRPAGRPQGPPLQSAVAFRCSPRSMLTRRGGACPRPPLSSPPQTPAVRAAIRAAPTENGWLPLLPSSNAHPPSIDRAVHIPRLEDAGLVPAHLFCSRLRLRTGGHKGRPYKARLLSAAPLVQCSRVGAGLVPAHLFPPRPRLPPSGRP